MRPPGSRWLAWLLERTWATVLAAVLASGLLTSALSWLLTRQPPGPTGLTISTVAAALLSWAASAQRNRHLRALQEVNARLAARVSEVERLRDELRELALHDPLTGLHNRRVLAEAAPALLARARRDAAPVAAVLLDVDDFKRVNDRFGHQAGDDVLRALAAHLAGQVRAGDLVCRYGGEEFAMLLPGLDAACAVARFEAIRSAWRAAPAPPPLASLPTLSAGIASFPRAGDDLDALLRAADDALYRAKGAGRDLVVVAD